MSKSFWTNITVSTRSSLKKNAANSLKRMQVKVWVNTNKSGSECSTVLDVDDALWGNMMDEEKEAMAREAVGGLYEWGWHEVVK